MRTDARPGGRRRAEVTEEKQAAGSLTIRVPESFCVHRLPAVVARFRRRMPRVRLGFITCAQEGLRRDLQKGVTDLAFLLADSLAAADLCVQALGTERLVLVAPPGHRLAGVRGLALAELAGETLLLSRVDCSYRRLLEAELTAAGVAPGLVLEFNSVAAIITHVRAGLGLTLLPEVAARAELKRGGLAALAWPEEGLETACLMVWHRDKWLSTPHGFHAAAREVLLEGQAKNQGKEFKCSWGRGLPWLRSWRQGTGRKRRDRPSHLRVMRRLPPRGAAASCPRIPASLARSSNRTRP